MAKKAPEIPLHEQVILEPELEEALKNATDAEMCDIAGKIYYCYCLLLLLIVWQHYTYVVYILYTHWFFTSAT